MQKVNVNVGANANGTSKPVTLADIAKIVGCSESHAYCVLAGRNNGTDANKIREVAQKMNYTRRTWDVSNLDKIPAPSAPVTSLVDLARLIGVSPSNIYKVYRGESGSDEFVAYVRAAAERFGYTREGKRKYSKPSGYISAKDIAQRTGYSVHTVRNALESTPNRLPTATILKIRNAAKEMGYDPTRYQPPHTGKQNPHAYLKHSNFPSPEVEKERMEILRKQGYTNEEIAQKIGKSYLHVLTKLGTQPKAITQMSYAAAAADRRFRKQLRERYQLQGMLDEYIAAEAELEQMKAKESALKAKIVELKPHVDRAGQLDRQISSK